MTTERESFLDAIRYSPEETTARFAFADWLTENGEPVLGNLLNAVTRGAEATGTPQPAIDYLFAIGTNDQANVLATLIKRLALTHDRVRESHDFATGLHRATIALRAEANVMPYHAVLTCDLAGPHYDSARALLMETAAKLLPIRSMECNYFSENLVKYLSQAGVLSGLNSFTVYDGIRGLGTLLEKLPSRQLKKFSADVHDREAANCYYTTLKSFLYQLSCFRSACAIEDLHFGCTENDPMDARAFSSLKSTNFAQLKSFSVKNSLKEMDAAAMRELIDSNLQNLEQLTLPRLTSDAFSLLTDAIRDGVFPALKAARSAGWDEQLAEAVHYHQVMAGVGPQRADGSRSGPGATGGLGT